MIDITQSDIEILKKLLKTPGLPGREYLVSEIIKESLPEEGWIIYEDVIGNLSARKPGKGLKILFIAHMDEVGLIIRRIQNDGFLLVERFGGICVEALPGNALDLWTRNNRYDALVGVKSAHISDMNGSVRELHELYLDIGADSKEEVKELGIRVGDGLTWKSDFYLINNKRIRSKALDNRLGCFALIKLAKLLQEQHINYDITVSFITQEESMILEAAPIINKYRPDIAIGIDGTLTFDTPDITNTQCDIQLGQGPCVKIMDAIRGKTSYLPSWNLTNQITNYLESTDISYQPEVVVGLSTALSLVPFLNNGVRSACLSLPIRYHHSPVELADLDDVNNLISLLVSLLKNSILE